MIKAIKTFLAIVKRELRAVSRERTIVIAILIQLFIASFSSAILIGLLSFYDPDSIGANTRATVRVGWLGSTDSPLVRILRERNVRVRPFATPAEAESAFQAQTIDAILVMPDAVPPASAGAPATSSPVEMKLILPRSETTASLITLILREPLKQYENVLRQERGLSVRYSDVRGQPSTSFEFLYSVIIPVLMFFPAFVAGSMTVDSISEEVESHTLETLISAPLSLNTVLAGKIVAALLLAAIQCVVWVGLLRLNRIVIQNAGLVLLLAALVAALNAFGSAFTAVAFRDRERSQFTYSMLIVIAVSASYFANASPLRLMTQFAIGEAGGAGALAGYGAALALLVVVFFRATHKMVNV